ncbi:MAG: hypothetical protein ACKVQU_08365 [Burkholderiales bacterium]
MGAYRGGLSEHAPSVVVVGLIHDIDGVAGTRQRIEAARPHAPRFGIATECGFGTQPAKRVPALPDVHSQVLPASDGD